jgi:hypothetical protein
MSEINLKENVKKLVELNNEEEKYKNICLNIKKQKEELNTSIMAYMEKNNATNKDIIFGDKKIKYSSSNIQDSVTKKLINDRLKIFLKDDVLANNATNFIYSDRNSSKKSFLKISDINK